MACIDGRVLPTDICGEILSWLPAKEVLRFRSISRSFSVSSRDTFFFKSHWRHVAKEDSGIFLRGHHGGFRMVMTDTCSGLPPESVAFLKKGDKRILGSGGGLVLYDVRVHGQPQHQPDESSIFYVYNPVRRTMQQVPPLPENAGIKILNVRTTGVAFLFGVDDQDGAAAADEEDNYAIVCMQPTTEWGAFMACWLYSSREAAWKVVGDNKLHVGPRNINFYSPVVSGKSTIFLASDCGPYNRQDPYIVAVNVDAGTSEILHLPEDAHELDAMEISAGTGPSPLSLITYSSASARFTIWDATTMYPRTPRAWERRGQVDIMAYSSSTTGMGMGSTLEQIKPTAVRGFTLVNGKTLVFAVEDDIYVHNLTGGVGSTPRLIRAQEGEGCCMSYMCSYANTFRPCGPSEMDEQD